MRAAILTLLWAVTWGCFESTGPPKGPPDCATCRGIEEPRIELGTATPLDDREAEFHLLPQDGVVELYATPGIAWVLPLRVRAEGFCWPDVEVRSQYVGCSGDSCSGRVLTYYPKEELPEMIPEAVRLPNNPPLCDPPRVNDALAWVAPPDSIEVLITVSELGSGVCGDASLSQSRQFGVVPACAADDALCSGRCFR